jgi:hypothetical protein
MIVLMVAAPLFALSSYVQGRLALSWREVSAYIRTLNCNLSTHVDVKHLSFNTLFTCSTLLQMCLRTL